MCVETNNLKKLLPEKMKKKYKKLHLYVDAGSEKVSGNVFQRFTVHRPLHNT